MAILKIGSLVPYGGPILRKEIITNSVKLVTSDSVKIAAGFVSLGTAGKSVFGHAMGISTNKGVGLNTTGVTGSEIGSFAGTYTVASDNQTVAMVRAEVDISQNTLYSAELDAAAGTTTGSDLLGYKMDLIDANTLDESTAVVTTAQYNSFGLDPVDSTKAIVNIFESFVFNDAQV